jgi:iron complex outermembrane receptor protein
MRASSGIYRILSAVALLLLAVRTEAAEIHGRVVSKSDGEFLAGVSIRLTGTLRGTTTDADGEFHLRDIEPGTYGLTISCVGFGREVIGGLVLAEGDSLFRVIELTAVAIQTEPVVVIASKREQSIQEVPISVSLMESRAIEERNFPSVEDAMRYVPGVNVVDAQVSIRGSSGYSRGAGSRVLMLVDGIPLLTADTGELNFETIPVGQVDRLEVSKGAGSALYGSNALGGVINVITRPIPHEPETRVRLYGGLYASPSYPEWDWGGGTRFMDGETFTHGRRIGDTGLLLSASRTADEGYRQNDYRKRLNGYAKVKHDFSPNSALTGTFNIMHQERGSFLNWKDLSNALVPPDVQQGDWIQSDRFFLSGQYQHVESTDLMITGRGIWYHNLFKDNIDTVTHQSRSDMYRGEGQATWTVHQDHILTFGVEGNAEVVEADLFGDRTGAGFGIYVQDEISFSPSLQLTLGARFDYQDLDSLESDSELSPKVGLMYSPWAGSRFRASAGRGFRSPTAAEAFVTTMLSIITIVPNPALQSERSVSYEVGLNQVLGEIMLFDLALFQTDFSNLIEPRFISGTTGQFTNVTRARIRGLEANLAAGFLSRRLVFNLGYTLTDPRDLTEDDVLKYRHRHLVYLNGTFQHGIVLVGVDFRYLSEVERIDEEFAAVIPDADERVPISVVDVRAGVDFTENGLPLSLILNIKNLFQYNYVEFIGNLAAPRSFILTLETAF